MNVWSGFDHPWATVWTWALLHFIWQGAVIVAIAGGVLRLARPEVRYGWLVALFGLMTASPVLTVWWLSSAPETVHFAARDVPMAGGEELCASQSIDDDELLPSLTDEGYEAPSFSIAAIRLKLIDQWKPIILTGWCAGVGLFVSRLILGGFGLSQLVTGAKKSPPSWITLGNRLAFRLQFCRPVRILCSTGVGEPLAVWWCRPVILLPAAWLTDVPPSVLEAVLAHELAHLRRGDLWVNFYQRLGETLLFYHPGVWWLSHRIRLERELCCDAAAVRLIGAPAGYARALEYVARRRLEQVRPLYAAGMGGTEMTLLSRIQRVLGMESPRRNSGGWSLGMASAAILVAGGLMFAVSSRDVIGEEPADPVTGSLASEADDRVPSPTDEDRPPRDAGPPRRGPREGDERGPRRPPGPWGEGPERRGPPPGGDIMRELMEEIRALRHEVSQLRDEVRGMRGPGGPDRGVRGPGRGDRGGPPDGDRRGPPRDGERGGPEGRRGPPPGDRPQRPPQEEKVEQDV